MTKQIIFAVLEQYADWEAAYLSSAIYMLGQKQFEVKTVSLNQEKISSIGGFHVIPDYTIDTMPSDFEALILIGGMTWRDEKSRKIKSLVDKCLDNGKVLGGICDASAFLGTIGVLNHVNHTSNDLNDLKNWAGEAYTGDETYIMEQAVSDKNIITANGTAALEFAREVLLALNVAPKDKIMEWYHFHKLGYYKSAMPKEATSWNE